VGKSQGIVTIQNYLGGFYYFKSDEIEVKGKDAFLIEGKHSRNNSLPSLGDIKDGLLKIILFTNLEDVKIDGKNYNPIPVLKLTTGKGFEPQNLNKPQTETLGLLRKEAKLNGFELWFK